VCLGGGKGRGRGTYEAPARTNGKRKKTGDASPHPSGHWQPGKTQVGTCVSPGLSLTQSVEKRTICPPIYAHPSIHQATPGQPEARVSPAPPPWLRSRQPSTPPQPIQWLSLSLAGLGWAGLWELYQEDRTAHTRNICHGRMPYITPAVKIIGWLWLAVAGWMVGCLATVRWNTHTNRRHQYYTDRKTERARGAERNSSAGSATQADNSTTTSNHVKCCAPNAALSV